MYETLLLLMYIIIIVVDSDLDSCAIQDGIYHVIHTIGISRS